MVGLVMRQVEMLCVWVTMVTIVLLASMTAAVPCEVQEVKAVIYSCMEHLANIHTSVLFAQPGDFKKTCR